MADSLTTLTPSRIGTRRRSDTMDPLFRLIDRNIKRFSSIVFLFYSFASLRSCHSLLYSVSPQSNGGGIHQSAYRENFLFYKGYRRSFHRISSSIRSTSTIELYTLRDKRGEHHSTKNEKPITKIKQTRTMSQPSFFEVTASSHLSLTRDFNPNVKRIMDASSPVGVNIFQHFTPAYQKDQDIPIQQTETLNDFTQKNNMPQSKPSSTIPSTISLNRNIMCLLSDDEGEEDSSVPDSSEEAANQIADKTIYFRISDEAKAKATRAVQKKEKTTISSNSGKFRDDLDQRTWHMEDSDDNVLNDTEGRRLGRTKVTASVQETGMDTMSSYVKSLGQHQLLPKDSEVLLGRQIQTLLKWEQIRQGLEQELSVAPTFGQWAETLQITVPELKKQIRKSQRAKAALMEANLRLVVTVARQSVKQGRSEINFQDACQEGIIGLTKACEKFDPEKGFRFSTYAIWWIKREIHKSITEQSRSIRLPTNVMQKINEIRINERVLISSLGRRPTDEEVAQKSSLDVQKLLFYRKAAQDAISLDKKIVARVGKGSNASGGEDNGRTIESTVMDSAPSPTDAVNKDMLRDDVRNLIKTLSPREQVVIRLRFGLDDGTPRTLDFIAKKFLVETDQIRKIEARALLKLRQPYRNQSVQCYEPDL